MKDFMIALGVTAILAVAFVALCFGFGWFGLGMTKTFAPKYEQVRYDVFKQSQSYNDGVANDLGNAQLQYARAKTESEKDAIASVMYERYQSYDMSKAPEDIQSFWQQIKAREGIH